MAQYVFNQPELFDESRAVLHHIKLDMVAAHQFSWRAVHNNMLMRRSIAFENLSGMKIDLIHAPFKGTNLFLENWLSYSVQKANTEQASAHTVFTTEQRPRSLTPPCLA